MTNQLTQITDKLYAVEVCHTSKRVNGNFYFPNAGFKENVPFRFQILGFVTEESIDFNCEKYLENQGTNEYKWYKDFTDESMMLFNIDDSFRSLLSSRGLFWTNSNLPPDKSYYRSTYDCAFHRYKWQEPYEQALEKFKYNESKKLSPETKLLIIEK